jgi:hypothetical protein
VTDIEVHLSFDYLPYVSLARDAKSPNFGGLKDTQAGIKYLLLMMVRNEEQ